MLICKPLFVIFSLIILGKFANGQADMTFFITSVGAGDGANLGGLAGADQHCQQLAAAAGAGGRMWRAYLSTSGANAINARDRIGPGPWQNRAGVMVAQNVADLHSDNNNLNKASATNELGVVVNGRGDSPNRHDILTGSNLDGTAVAGAALTCDNWSSNGAGSAKVGHHDRQGGGANPTSWNAAHDSRGCSQANLQGSGGDGLFYCFGLDAATSAPTTAPPTVAPPTGAPTTMAPTPAAPTNAPPSAPPTLAGGGAPTAPPSFGGGAPTAPPSFGGGAPTAPPSYAAGAPTLPGGGGPPPSYYAGPPTVPPNIVAGDSWETGLGASLSAALGFAVPLWAFVATLVLIVVLCFAIACVAIVVCRRRSQNQGNFHAYQHNTMMQQQPPHGAPNYTNNTTSSTMYARPHQRSSRGGSRRASGTFSGSRRPSRRQSRTVAGARGPPPTYH